MLILASFWQGLLATLFVLVGLLMIGIILLQKNRGSGLSGAFGGVGGHSAFGTKTGDFLTWVTVGFTAALILLAIVSNYAFQPTSSAEMMGISPAGGAPVLPANVPMPANVPGQSAPAKPTTPTGGTAVPINIPPTAPGGSAGSPATPSPTTPPPPPAGAPAQPVKP